MKKYFAMLVVLFAAAVMTSCVKKPVVPQLPTGDVTLDNAVYYGEKLKSGHGYYSITLAQGDNKLRLDLISDVANDKENAKLSATAFTLGTKEDLKKKTTFVAASAEDAEGTIYYKGQTGVLVTAATVDVKTGGGKYTVIAKITAGGEAISMQYNGNIIFKNESVLADRTITATQWSASYQGDFNEASKDMGYMGLILANPDIANQKLQLAITVPLPTEGPYLNDHAKMPIGEFNVVSSVSDVNQIVAGKLSNNIASQSWELKVNPENGGFNGGVKIEGGTINIEKVTKDGKPGYKITTDMHGTSYDVNQNPLGKINHLRYVMEYAEAYNEGDYMLDATAPGSDLKGDYVFEKLANASYEIQGNTATPSDPLKLVYLFLSEKENQVEFNAAKSQYEFTGDGDLVVLQFWMNHASLEDFLPTGTFTMESDWGKEQAGTCIAAVVGSDSAPFAPTAGCWYLKTEQDGNSLNLKGSTGMIPKKGTLKLSGTKKAYNIEYEFWDKYGNKMTAKYTTETRSTESPILGASTSNYMFRPTMTLR